MPQRGWDGRPAEPARSGWHWVEDGDGLRPLLWHGEDWLEVCDRGEWQDGFAALSPHALIRARYHGPLAMPPAVAAWFRHALLAGTAAAAPSSPASAPAVAPPLLFRLVYCSRSAIGDAHDDVVREIARILAVSRRDNARDGITGALLYDEDCFAQVLEGPLEAVERVFERIRRDRRHNDVTVLENAPQRERLFVHWSMVLVGEAPGRRPGDGLQLARALVARGAAQDAARDPVRDLLTGERVAARLHTLLLQRGEPPA